MPQSCGKLQARQFQKNRQEQEKRAETNTYRGLIKHRTENYVKKSRNKKGA